MYSRCSPVPDEIRFGGVSSSFAVAEFQRFCWWFRTESKFGLANTLSEAADISVAQVSTFQSTHDEIKKSIADEMTASHQKDVELLAATSADGVGTPKRLPKVQTDADVELLRETIAFSAIPTLDSLTARNRSSGLAIFSERAADDILAEIGNAEPATVTAKMRRREAYVPEDMPPLQLPSAAGSAVAPGFDIMFSVCIFHPAKAGKSQEFLCRGSQLLTELRDVIFCLSSLQEQPIGEESAFFFIDGVFYVDRRHPASKDYSETIRKFFPEKNLSVADMAETRFIDLHLSVGSQYCYLHSGDVEHLMVFTEVRSSLIGLGDPDPQHAFYPWKVFESRPKRRLCGVCRLLSATRVTWEDQLADESPMFFCEDCFKALHYNKNLQLTYDSFRVFSYFHE